MLHVGLQVAAEQQFKSGKQARPVAPYLGKSGIKTQQNEFGVLLAAFVPSRYPLVSKPVDGGTVGRLGHMAMHSGKDIISLRHKSKNCQIFRLQPFQNCRVGRGEEPDRSLIFIPVQLRRHRTQ